MLQNFDGTEAGGARIYEPTQAVPFSLDDELAGSLASFLEYLEYRATLQDSERHFRSEVLPDGCIKFTGHVDPIVFDCLAETRNVQWERLDKDVAQFRAEAEMLETEGVFAEEAEVDPMVVTSGVLGTEPRDECRKSIDEAMQGCAGNLSQLYAPVPRELDSDYVTDYEAWERMSGIPPSSPAEEIVSKGNF